MQYSHDHRGEMTGSFEYRVDAIYRDDDYPDLGEMFDSKTFGGPKLAGQEVARLRKQLNVKIEDRPTLIAVTLKRRPRGPWETVREYRE